jgi:formylglycine-generating enzyme required for sulfatase activity
MDTTEVTNRQFARFVAATGHVTDQWWTYEKSFRTVKDARARVSDD